MGQGKCFFPVNDEEEEIATAMQSSAAMQQSCTRGQYNCFLLSSEQGRGEGEKCGGRGGGGGGEQGGGRGGRGGQDHNYNTVVLMGLGYHVLHTLVNKLEEEEEEEIEEELAVVCFSRT